MRISAKTGRNNKRHIYIDGVYSVTTQKNVWQSLGLNDDDEISEETWGKILSKIYFEKIYSSALTFLTRREHSRYELYQKLYQKFVLKPSQNSDKGNLPDFADKNFIADHIEMVCDRLEETNLLSDERYARLYSEELVRVKRMGMSGIKTALLKKGISKEIIETVCSELDHNPNELIKEILKVRYRHFDLYDEAQQAKAINYLVRRGYRLSEIRQALYEFLEDYVAPY